MAIPLEELADQPFVKAHRDLYKVALERMSFSERNSDREFWNDLDPDVRDAVRAQLRDYGDKPAWRLL